MLLLMGASRRRVVSLAAIGAAALAACNTLTGADELGIDDGVTVDAPGREGGPVSPGDDAAPPDDASHSDGPTSDDAGWCGALLAYFPYDGDSQSVQKHKPNVTAGVEYVPAKLGTGIELASSAEQIRYPVPPTSPIYSLTEGSAVMWIKPSFPVPCPDGGGTIMDFGGGLSFVCAAAPSGPALITPLTSAALVSSSLKIDVFLHVALTWRQKPTDGGESLSFTVSGGATKAVRASSMQAWTGDPNQAALKIGGMGLAVGTIDELAFFNRVLAQDEIKEIASLTVPLRTRCNFP